MNDLINGRTPKVIKSGIRNMLETCADISGVKDEVCWEMCCSYSGDNCCHETILMEALNYIEHLEAKIARRDALLAEMGVGIREEIAKAMAE